MDIFVADDDRSARFLLSSTLIELGHSVTEATNGCESVGGLETQAPPARYLRLDDAGGRWVGALPKNSRRRRIGLRLHHPDYGARGKGQLSGRDGFRR